MHYLQTLNDVKVVQAIFSPIVMAVPHKLGRKYRAAAAGLNSVVMFMRSGWDAVMSFRSWWEC